MLALLHMNRLQRKVLLVILVIIVVPMLITGWLSASWIAGRTDESIERWIREAAEVNKASLNRIHENSRLLADVLEETAHGELQLDSTASPIPPQLEKLARELGINLVQVYDADGKLVYSSHPIRLATSWSHGQDTAVVKVDQDGKGMLAAITIIRVPRDAPRHYRLVLGTLFDKNLLNHLSQASGLKTRLFYPREGDFAKAFSEEDQPLRLRLPPVAFAQLQQRQTYYSKQAESGEYWGLYTPVVDATGTVEAVLFSGLARQGGTRLLTDQAALTVAITLLGLLLATVTGLLLGRIVVRPVEYLRDGVMKVAAQDFKAEIPLYSRDELGDLAHAFNEMAQRLREARDEQRREFQRDKIAALGELSLAMAHEIRNPIGVINTASRLMESSEDPAKRAELRRVIREESLRLDQFLRDFQQLARHRHPEFATLDPLEPLEAALQVMLAGREDIAVERHIDHGLCRVRADRELLRQAWVNLIRNALEAMGEAIGSMPGRLMIHSSCAGNSVSVLLRDSGPGVSLEQMTRLFEPFFSTKEQGSGLGLTIASTLVEANGARLELVPDTGPGACFAMRFQITHEDS
ncbi:MAG: HAMP domain-containing protein [Gammaproteobacteria bacterium]|nr:HAMP domain-containing protein [Gammaproteobacteria bacterium]